MRTHRIAARGTLPRFAQTTLIAFGALVGAMTDVARADLVVTDNGGATIIRNGDMWEIRAADGTIIEYSRFDIGPDQLVEFFQGGAGNRVLNRVDGPMSLIEGILRADGTIYIVNPAGVLFAGGSVVDVGGLYAAAGDMSNADFIGGVDRFTDLSGEVVVQAGAQIGGGPNHSTGAIHLIGKRVENHGILMSDGGIITMLAGDSVMLQEVGGRVVVFVDGQRLTDLDGPVAGATSGRMTGTARVINTGEIHNPGGQVVFGAGDMTSLAFRNSGLISAPGGDVQIVAANGGFRSEGEIVADDVVVQASTARTYNGSSITADTVTIQTNRNLSLRFGSLLDAIDAWIEADADEDGSGFLNVDISLTLGGDLTMIGEDIFFRGRTLETGGRQHYIGDYWLGEDTELTARSVTFDGRVNSRAVEGRQDRRLVVNGDAWFNGTVGDTEFGLLKSLVVNGRSAINGGLVRTSGNQIFAGAVVLGANARLLTEEAGLIRFADTIDGPHDLLVETAGLTRFDGDANVGSIETDAAGTTRISGDLSAASTLTFRDAVELGANVALTGAERAEFFKKITGNGHDLDVNGEQTLFHGRVLDVRRLETDDAGTTVIDTDRVNARSIALGDDVTVTGDARIKVSEFAAFGGTLDGPGDLEIIAGDLIDFGDDVGGLDPFASLTLDAGGRDAGDSNTIHADGQLIRAAGDILINPRGKRDPHRVASLGAEGDLTVRSLTGDIFVGTNEKITALGRLELVAKEGRITHNDLNALTAIRVDSPDIRIYEREAGFVLDSSGNVDLDLGTDVIAGDSIKYSSVPKFFGPGSVALFATQDGALIVGPNQARFFPVDVTEAALAGGPILDLAIGSTTRRGNLASAYETEGDVNDRVLLEPFAAETFQDRLGLVLRELDDQELRSTLAGRQLFLDTPSTDRDPAGAPVVTTNRLRRASVYRVLDQYASIFLRERADPATGETVKEDQGEHIRTVLGWAWDDYAAIEPAPSGSGFRAYVEATPEHAEALDYLHGLQGLFDEMWVMGVNTFELQTSLNRVLTDVRPAGMNQDLLEGAIGADTLG